MVSHRWLGQTRLAFFLSPFQSLLLPFCLHLLDFEFMSVGQILCILVSRLERFWKKGQQKFCWSVVSWRCHVSRPKLGTLLPKMPVYMVFQWEELVADLAAISLQRWCRERRDSAASWWALHHADWDSWWWELLGQSQNSRQACTRQLFSGFELRSFRPTPLTFRSNYPAPKAAASLSLHSPKSSNYVYAPNSVLNPLLAGHT